MADDTELGEFRNQLFKAARSAPTDLGGPYERDHAHRAVVALWPLVEARCRRLEAERNTAIDETIDILQPLVNYLCEQHPDRYSGRHCIDVALELLAERDAARVDALNEAAAAIRAHADKHAPRDGNFSQQRMRRHLRIAEQVVLNCDPPSLAEVSEAFAAAVRGLPVPETQEPQT